MHLQFLIITSLNKYKQTRKKMNQKNKYKQTRKYALHKAEFLERSTYLHSSTTLKSDVPLS